jgi:hypothetical protein
MKRDRKMFRPTPAVAVEKRGQPVAGRWDESCTVTGRIAAFAPPVGRQGVTPVS